MSGRFKKAPLVYVAARILISQLPKLTEEQHALLQQNLIRLGLTNRIEGKVQQFDFSPSDIEEGSMALTASTTHRYGFFSSDKTNALILDGNYIEWRATTYTKYFGFIEKFEAALNELINTIDSLGFIEAKEFTLSYADVIAPSANRDLKDYFQASESILPLSVINREKKEDSQSFGSIQSTHVTSPNQKITTTLEQLPVIERQVRKFLPEALAEPDHNFSMPIFLHDEWVNLDTKYYALLMTQAAMLQTVTLKELKPKEIFKDLHEVTKETFKSLLNQNTCHTDWEFTEEQG
ncbi:MAG: hypothetical protein ACI9CO_000103 [Candidatus Azotimanducaceae bacterium]|jgi:uncharacterized protein (TIGR04255 family)